MTACWRTASVMVSRKDDPLKNRVWKYGVGGLLAGLCAAVAAQTSPGALSIYTCVDKQGRKLTSDRPIPECIDREQRELGPSGTLRRVIGPTLTQQEREALEVQRRTRHWLKAGVLTSEVKRFIDAEHRKLGGEGGSWFCLVSFGDDTCLPHGGEGDRALRIAGAVMIAAGVMALGW